ncbi:lamin tail domain-containing protein, partial [Candidatus Uhrbacteria bacterium]|nr:lamin tail domain-containing protein [Candidatus Uhrbacteria bacterium]
VYTGTGTSTPTALYWGRGNGVWNDGGDTATLLDATGATIDELSYPAIPEE